MAGHIQRHMEKMSWAVINYRDQAWWRARQMNIKSGPSDLRHPARYRIQNWETDLENFWKKGVIGTWWTNSMKMNNMSHNVGVISLSIGRFGGGLVWKIITRGHFAPDVPYLAVSVLWFLGVTGLRDHGGCAPQAVIDRWSWPLARMVRIMVVSTCGYSAFRAGCIGKRCCVLCSCYAFYGG